MLVKLKSLEQGNKWPLEDTKCLQELQDELLRFNREELMKGIDEVIAITNDKKANQSIIVSLFRKAMGIALVVGVMHYLIMGPQKPEAAVVAPD